MTDKMKKTEGKIENGKEEKVVGTRGRIFEGRVIKKFHKRLTIVFNRMIYIKKYERYAKSRTKLHARLPEHLEKEIKVGDLIQIRECRPLSKIVHFMVIKKIKDAEEVKQ